MSKPKAYLLAVAVTGGVAWPAGAATITSSPTPLRAIGGLAGSPPAGAVLASDGRRWVLWHDGEHVHRFDDRTGRRSLVSGVGGCGMAALRPWTLTPWIIMSAGGAAVIHCWKPDVYGTPTLEHYVFDPVGGSARRMGGTAPRDAFGRIGRRWAEGSVDPGSTKTATLVLVNWRSGQRLEYDTTRCFDLDASVPEPLPRRTCSQMDGTPCREASRCSIQSGGGWETRVRISGVRASVDALHDRSARRFRWRLARLRHAPPPGETGWVAARHTRRFLFVAVPSRYEHSSSGATSVVRYRLLQARLPRVR
jgi:hypothetical protein